jgi:hypothetical protein
MQDASTMTIDSLVLILIRPLQKKVCSDVLTKKKEQKKKGFECHSDILRNLGALAHCAWVLPVVARQLPGLCGA